MQEIVTCHLEFQHISCFILNSKHDIFKKLTQAEHNQEVVNRLKLCGRYTYMY